MRLYSDEEIIKTFKRNDTNGCNDVLKSIYKVYYPVIQKFILSNSGNDSEARDIFQDTIMTFYEQAKEKNFNLTCAVKTYIYSISRNLWLKRLGNLRRFDKSVTDIEDFVSIDDINDHYSQEPDTEKILAGLLERLDSRCRDILIYYYFEKMKMKDIKVRMKLGSEQSAKNKKYKCMKHLMEMAKNDKNLNVILKERF